MSRKLKFALVYTAILALPVLLVLIAAGAGTNDLSGFVEAFAANFGWLYWPVLLFWPWITVIADLLRRKPGAPRNA